METEEAMSSKSRRQRETVAVAQVEPLALARLRGELVATGEVQRAGRHRLPHLQYAVRGVPTRDADVLVEEQGLAGGGVPVAFVEQGAGPDGSPHVRIRIAAYERDRGIEHATAPVGVERDDRAVRLRVGQLVIRLAGAALLLGVVQGIR